MSATPIYAETVRATGIVPDGFPTAAEIPAGSAVVEFPTIRASVIIAGAWPSATPAPLSVPSARLPAVEPVTPKRRRSRALPRGQ